MNQTNPTQTTPDLESLRKAIQEFQPNSSRLPFGNLKPVHDSIALLRSKGASYSAIAELLAQNGVKTSRARVAEYGRVVLEGGKSRKRRKRAYTKSTTQTPVTQPPPSAVGTAVLPTSSPTGPFSPNPGSVFAERKRGPRIANVRMLKPLATVGADASEPSKTPVTPP